MWFADLYSTGSHSNESSFVSRTSRVVLMLKPGGGLFYQHISQREDKSVLRRKTHKIFPPNRHFLTLCLGKQLIFNWQLASSGLVQIRFDAFYWELSYEQLNAKTKLMEQQLATPNLIRVNIRVETVDLLEKQFAVCICIATM